MFKFSVGYSCFPQLYPHCRNLFLFSSKSVSFSLVLGSFFSKFLCVLCRICLVRVFSYFLQHVGFEYG